MLQGNVQIEEIAVHCIDLLLLDHLQFHVDQVIIPVFDIFVAIESLILIQLHYVQVTLNFRINEETIELPPTLPRYRISRYSSFSRSNSRNRQIFRNYNSPYRPASRPRS